MWSSHFLRKYLYLCLGSSKLIWGSCGQVIVSDKHAQLVGNCNIQGNRCIRKPTAWIEFDGWLVGWLVGWLGGSHY